MHNQKATEVFDQIYQTDLVYVPDCWKLCGDAHCCNFSRYKAKFRLLAATHFQELPLLPGELEYLQERGWLAQFGVYEHRKIVYQIDHRGLLVESIISRKASCACDHDTRPTVCRLYPLLPVFDPVGKLVGIDTFGIYEELENLDRLAPACQLTTVPFPELNKFLLLTANIAQHPILLYYITAYQIAKEHIRSRLQALQSDRSDSAFGIFEWALIRNRLIDHPSLKARLGKLADDFEQRYGAAFQLFQPGAD